MSSKKITGARLEIFRGTGKQSKNFYWRHIGKNGKYIAGSVQPINKKEDIINTQREYYPAFFAKLVDLTVVVAKPAAPKKKAAPKKAAAKPAAKKSAAKPAAKKAK